VERFDTVARSGDELAGVAAKTREEHVAAKVALGTDCDMRSGVSLMFERPPALPDSAVSRR
jgi:ethanolamine ammonia-lyase large subunit